MPGSLHEQIIEIVRFQESGLTDIDARTKSFKQNIDEATKRSQALAGVLADPSFARHAARMNELARSTERQMTAARNATRANDLASGAFGRHAAAMAKLNAESRKLDQGERIANLVAQHGKWGGILKANASQFATLRNVALGTTLGMTGLALGLVRSGLQGTVEGYRLEYAWTRLSRQLAAVAIPAIDLLSKTVGRVAGWFEKLSGTQQNTLLGMGAFAVASLTTVSALGSLVTVGRAVIDIFNGIRAASAAAAVAQGASGLAGGIGGAVGGLGGVAAGVGGVAAGAGGVAGGLMARGAIGAAATRAAAGTALALGAGGALARRAPLALPAASPAVRILGVTANAPAQAAPGLLSRVAPFLGRAAPFVGGALGAVEAGRGLMREHEAGGIMGVGRGIGRGFARAADLPFDLMMGPLGKLIPGLDRGPITRLFDSVFGKEGESMAEGKHRDITPLQTGIEEPGSAFARIQEEFLKVSAASEEQKASQQQFKDSVDKFAKAVEDQAKQTQERVEHNGARGLGVVDESYAEYMRRLANEIRKAGG